MAVVSGEYVMVFISPATGITTWKSVAHATSHTLTIKSDTRDTSNKGTGHFKTKEYGRTEVTATLQGMCIDDDTYNYADFAEMILARAPFLMVFGQATTSGGTQPMTTSTAGGTIFYASGQFIVPSLDMVFPDEQNSTYTVTFEHYTGFVLNTLAT